MILLESAASGPRHMVLLFGAGLIGSAILRSLRSAGTMSADRFPMRWADSGGFASDLGSAEEVVRRRRDAGAPPLLTFVWSAGQASFDAGAEDTAAELARFSEVLSLARRVCSGPREESIHFVMISSAGGLYEGQRIVTEASRPEPRRAYARLKLEQQRLLLERAPALRPTVLLLSSVYGLARAGQRAGLVSTLIVNGLRRRVTTISGTMSTLRDFVWAGDVGRFAANQVLHPAGGTGSPRILASGPPRFDLRDPEHGPGNARQANRPRLLAPGVESRRHHVRAVRAAAGLVGERSPNEHSDESTATRSVRFRPRHDASVVGGGLRPIYSRRSSDFFDGRIDRA